MSKTINQMIADIKKASERENLVIFIGAGVSINSGYRLWDSLIGVFNGELKYSLKTSHFSSDEMLKIPQYFYNENIGRYYEIVKREYGKLPDQTNAIIDELLNLKPVHIITTNFDLLIEKSLEENHIYGNTVYGSLGKYSIIRSDDDFVNAEKNHYLIKMHGDVESLDSLVLKEEDYLQYSSTHTLIETFIKSLFVNHTILFIGYGLGDYNIKLIMSWVDGILKNQKIQNDNDRFSYYFINSDSEPLKNYEKDYYRKQNIFVIESANVPSDFSAPNYDKKKVAFDNVRGNNLLRICKYIKYGSDNDLVEIMKNLSVFDNIDCITDKELMFKLGDYSIRHNTHDNILSIRGDQLSIQLKTIIDILVNNVNTTEVAYFTSVFKKAGIDTIVSEFSESDNKQIVNLMDSYENADVLYTSIIECNIRKLYELCQEPYSDQRIMLQAGYLHSILDNNEKALQLLNEAMSHYHSDYDFFHLLICHQNICKISIKEEQIWYILKNNLSEEDKNTYRTLYDYLDDTDEIYQETIEAYKFFERKFDVNYHGVYWDEDNLTFLKLRNHIHQMQKYFIQNNIYIKGYSGFTHIIGNWLKALDLYVDLVLLLHSPNIKMHRENMTYKRTVLKKEDIYILVTHPKDNDLKYILNKYNIKLITVSDGCTDYIISLLNNYVDAFEFQSILGFKFANDIKNILSLIQVIDFKLEQYNSLFQSYTNLLIRIMSSYFDKKDYYFTVFRDIPVGILECIFSILRFRKANVQIESLTNSIENILLCFINTSAEDNIGFAVFEQCSILINFSEALKHYYKGIISENITNKFLEIIQEKHPDMLYKFIIEIFPILSEQQKVKWRMSAGNLGNDPFYIRLGILNSVFCYDDKIGTILINMCRQQIKVRPPENEKNIQLSPLYNVLRLVEKGFITDLEPYREFLGNYDFFDFVCFPNDFDYTKYDTSWGSWLTLEKYREYAFKSAYETLTRKYDQAMKDGPSETEKSIYYKYFCCEDDAY